MTNLINSGLLTLELDFFFLICNFTSYILYDCIKEINSSSCLNLNWVEQMVTGKHKYTQTGLTQDCSEIGLFLELLQFSKITAYTRHVHMFN